MSPTVVVAGVDLCDEFDLLWSVESTLSPPPVRMNRMQLPARDGGLDLTEVLTGDAVFDDRPMELVFYVKRTDFEVIKTRMCNMLHGREFDFELSIDPGYTYHGRWECESYYSKLHYREIKFKVVCDPWKRGERKRYEVQCAGGEPITVENGRRHVTPTFTVQQACLIEYKGRAWEIPDAGTWTLDLRLDEGTSQIYVNSAPTMCETTWEDLAEQYPHWSDIPKGTRWSDVFMLKKKQASATSSMTWNDLFKLYTRWEDIPKGTRWIDLYKGEGGMPTGEQYNVVIEYDIYDL